MSDAFIVYWEENCFVVWMKGALKKNGCRFPYICRERTTCTKIGWIYWWRTSWSRFEGALQINVVTRQRLRQAALIGACMLLEENICSLLDAIIVLNWNTSSVLFLMYLFDMELQPRSNSTAHLLTVEKEGANS